MADATKSGWKLEPVEHDPFAPTLPLIAPVAPPIEDNQPGLLGRMLGAYAPPVRAVQLQTYPGAPDTAIARGVEQTYGDPVAGFDVPGSASRKISTSAILGRDNAALLRSKTPLVNTEGDRENILRNWLGAQRNPLSALGYDPRHVVETPAGGPSMTLGGVYTAPGVAKNAFILQPHQHESPRGDTIWYDGTKQDVVVHEAMHRGIEKLRQAGELPESFLDFERTHSLGEEYLVRAAKLKAFGEIEKGPDATDRDGNAQVETAKKLMKDPTQIKLSNNKPGNFNNILAELEAAAAAYAAKKHPGGPR